MIIAKDNQLNQSIIQESFQNLVSRAFGIGYSTIKLFLKDEEQSAIENFYLFSRKIYEMYQFAQEKKIRETYEKIKKAEPKKFEYSIEILEFIINRMLVMKNEKLLSRLVIPSYYFDYIGNYDFEVYKYYLNLFKKKKKSEQIEMFKDFVIKGDNWELVVRFLTKENNVFTNYLKKGIYSFKRERFLSNYEAYFKKKFDNNAITLNNEGLLNFGSL